MISPHRSFRRVFRDLLYKHIPSSGEGNRVPSLMEAPFAQTAEKLLTLRASTSTSFPDRDVEAVEGGEGTRSHSVVVNFMGLTGPVGYLPSYYTDLLARLARERRGETAGFFDLVNHRALFLFALSQVKYRLDASAELFRSPWKHPMGRTLAALCGISVEALQARRDDEVLAALRTVRYFAQGSRSASGLAAAIRQSLGGDCRVTITPLVGKWIALPPEEQTRLSSAPTLAPQHCRLNLDAVIGRRFWDVQGTIEVAVILKEFRSYEALLPDQPRFSGLAWIAAQFTRGDLVVRARFALPAEQIAPAVLRSVAAGGPRLGWTSWVGSPARRADVNGLVSDPCFQLGLGSKAA